MKKVFLSLSLVASFFFVAAQTVWIADNRPTRPGGNHVTSTFQAALDSAAPGDIIHVIPSQNSYGSPLINTDSLTIFGVGFNPQKDQPNKVWVANLTIQSNIFGIRISGINVTDNLNIGQSSPVNNGNIIIENGDIDRIDVAEPCCTNGAVSNVVIRNCVLGMRQTSSANIIDFIGSYFTGTSIVITNNVIMGSTHSSTYPSINVADAIVKNNLFLGNDQYDASFTGTINTTISNNIFIGRVANFGTSNCTFNNNITYGVAAYSLPIGSSGNTGDTLLVNTDPLLVNVSATDNWSFSFDPTPDVGSPAIGTGNDGLDIGLTGGTIPFSVTGTPLPVINILRVPEIIKQGTDLNATIEATGN